MTQDKEIAELRDCISYMATYLGQDTYEHVRTELWPELDLPEWIYI